MARGGNNNNGGRGNSHGNQNSRPQNQGQNSRTGGNQSRACFKCGQPGHIANACTADQGNNSRQDQRSGSNTSRQHGSNNGQTKRCDHHPNSTNHTTAECSRPGNPNNSRSNSREDRDGDIQMEGFAYVAPAAMPPSTVPYCRGCNTTNHFEHACSNGQGSSYKLLYGREICWRCHLRGHTGDECHNPSQKSCDRCHKSGHLTMECKATSGPRLDFLRPSNLGKSRFEWVNLIGEQDLHGEALKCTLNKYLFECRVRNIHVPQEQIDEARRLIAEKEATLVWPTAAGPVAAPPVNLRQEIRTGFPVPGSGYRTTTGATSGFASSNFGNTSTFRGAPSGEQNDFYEFKAWKQEQVMSQRDREIRAKVAWSHEHYRKEKYNSFLQFRLKEIREKQLLSDHGVWRVSNIMNAHFTIWRDPKAIDAVSKCHKAKCNRCKQDGYILDRWFNIIPVRTDVRTLEDYDDWGLFVAFDCHCHKPESEGGAGYRYVALPEADLPVEDIEMS